MVAKIMDYGAADPLLDVKDLAKLLKCSERHIHRLKDKMPPPVRLGKLLRWRASEIEKFLRESEAR